MTVPGPIGGALLRDVSVILRWRRNERPSGPMLAPPPPEGHLHSPAALVIKSPHKSAKLVAVIPAEVLRELEKLAARLGIDVRFDSFDPHLRDKRGGLCTLRG